MEQDWSNALTILALGFTFVFLFLTVLIGCISVLRRVTPFLSRFLKMAEPTVMQPKKAIQPAQPLRAKAAAAALAVHHYRTNYVHQK